MGQGEVENTGWLEDTGKMSHIYQPKRGWLGCKEDHHVRGILWPVSYIKQS